MYQHSHMIHIRRIMYLLQRNTCWNCHAHFVRSLTYTLTVLTPYLI